MNQEEVNRKLSCILSMDAVGYSRLMEENEASTVRYLEENKKLISRLIEEYNGRVIDSPGDNLLAEFSSAVKAVDCAVKIQKELKIKNAELIETRRMEFRIGINLGDVIEEDGRIYGSGVNIAARLEGLADPGGICISRNVYDQVKTKLDLGYEYLGEHNVKNISEPVRVYRVMTGTETTGTVPNKKVFSRISYKRNIAIILIIIAAGITGWIVYNHQSPKIESASVETKETPLTNKIENSLKSIAVLPFDDFSPEKNQEYFVNGLSEEILNTIAQITDLKVISRTSSFSYKETNKKIQEIARELGVDHILEGSIRKAGNAIRITAQLIKADDGSHLWSETYDKNLEVKEIFAVQEDIAHNVADKLKLTIESLRLLGGTENIKAYELYLNAKGITDYNSALELLDEAIALDPEFAVAWAWKGMMHLFKANQRPYTPKNVSSEIDAALNAALKAKELEPNLGQAYLLLGAVNFWKGKFIEAEKGYRKGMALIPESTEYFQYGLIWHYIAIGYLKKSDALLEKMVRNDPLNPTLRAVYLMNLGFLGDMERAEREYKEGKTKFKNEWSLGDAFIMRLRLGAKNELSIEDIPESQRTEYIIGILEILKEESPEKRFAELDRISDNLEDIITSDSEIDVLSFAQRRDHKSKLEIIEKRIRLIPPISFWCCQFNCVNSFLPIF